MISPESPRTFNETAARPGAFNPLTLLRNLFSSIWLGVTLLFLLFVYSSIGSAGVPRGLNLLDGNNWILPREKFRWLEMTEFEWFHWWPFNLLIALICINLIVATLRRIPFKPVNYGVWMIHAGIITLCVGSVIYFGTKLEGDSPVIRRQVLVEVPGEKPVALPAIPGASARVGSGPGRYDLMIDEVNPHWEIISEPDKGAQAFKVSVRVQSPTQEFIRVLLAGYPQYTEDVVRTDDPAQPFKRAKKIQGDDKPLVDETLNLMLAHSPQEYFYLMNSSAIYLRELGTREWIQRPISGLPRYNEYLPTREDVWLDPNEPLPPIDPLDIDVPAEASTQAAETTKDPLHGTPIRVTGYLRYAQMQSKRTPGGDRVDPMATIQLTSAAEPDHGGETFELAAFDPAGNSVHVRDRERGELEVVRFRWIQDEAELAAMSESRTPQLKIAVPGAGVDLTAPIESVASANPDLPFTPIEGTDYSYRVKYVQDQLRMGDGHLVSVASIEIRNGERTWERWVFDQPGLTRDLEIGEEDPAHGRGLPTDENITIAYVPGNAPPPVLIAVGPGEKDVRVITTTRQGQQISADAVGKIVPITDDIALKIVSYSARSRMETRPAITPRAQRDRELLNRASMIKVEIPLGGRVDSLWLPFHDYAFESENHTLRRYPYRPSLLQLPSGQLVEIMFSRARRSLPAPVVLDDFILSEHVGGYSGDTLSVRDWTSVVRFADAGDWLPQKSASMNHPAEFRGYWFFQAQWDPPTPSRFEGDPSSAGLNFTVLGVGNRNGVHVQLVGCCIAVIGMIYAFYWKPIIKRRRKQQMHEQLAESRTYDDSGKTRARSRAAAQPIGAALEEQT